MALTAEQRKVLRIALGSKGDNGVADDIADQIDAAGEVGVAVADVVEADADATYGAEEQALINELKAQVNALLASLRDAGKIAE